MTNEIVRSEIPEDLADKDRKENNSADSAERRRKTALVSTSVLAYVGDAVYETYVRRHVFHQGLLRPDRLHRASVRYVRAEAQAAAFDALWDRLSPDEQAVARRGKNHKITSMPHNVDHKTYKKATAFEALLGYLNLSEEKEREAEIVDMAFRVIEENEIEMKRTGNPDMKGRKG